MVNIPGPVGQKLEPFPEFAVKLPKESSDLVLSCWKVPEPLMDEFDPWREKAFFPRASAPIEPAKISSVNEELSESLELSKLFVAWLVGQNGWTVSAD